jgi:hypothetical protein
MSGPPTTEGRPQGDHPGTGDVLSATTRTTVRRSAGVCRDCARRPAARGWNRCSACLRAYCAGLRRRRDAEARLQPLADFLGRSA